jgi:hypothetical protein
VARTSKLIHIDPNLRQDNFGHPPIDPRNPIQPLQCFRIPLQAEAGDWEIFLLLKGAIRSEISWSNASICFSRSAKRVISAIHSASFTSVFRPGTDAHVLSIDQQDGHLSF